MPLYHRLPKQEYFFFNEYNLGLHVDFLNQQGHFLTLQGKLFALLDRQIVVHGRNPHRIVRGAAETRR